MITVETSADLDSELWEAVGSILPLLTYTIRLCNKQTWEDVPKDIAYI